MFTIFFSYFLSIKTVCHKMFDMSQARVLRRSLMHGDDDTNQDNQSRKPRQEFYDPFQTPPDFHMAKNHGHAKRVYKLQSKRLNTESAEKLCPCCGLPTTGELIPLKASLSELYPLGSGYVLYFRLLKYSIALLGLLFVISGVFGTLSNLVAEDCFPSDADRDTAYCMRDYISIFTIANKRDSTELLKIQMVLNLVAIIAIIIFFQYIYYRLRQTIVEADTQTITPSDYTIELSGMQSDVKDERIIRWIESLGNHKNVIKCKKINKTYDIREYIKLNKEKDELIVKWRNEPDHITKLIYEDEMSKLDQQLEKLKEHGLTFTGNVFVSLEKAQQAEYLIKRYKRGVLVRWFSNFKSRVFRSAEELQPNKITIRRASEPTDVIWENQGYSAFHNFKARLVSEIGSIFLIALCFVLVVLISMGQTSLLADLDQGSVWVYALSFLASILVCTANYLLSEATRSLSKREKHTTYTAYFTGIASRLSASLFINTAFTTLFAKLTTLFFLGKEINILNDQDEFNFYTKGGLLENIFYVFISNALFTPLYTMFDPFYYWKLYDQRKALKQGKHCAMTQQKAHALFEELEIDLSFKNAYLIKTMLVSAFFAPALPLALIISIIGLIACYWADKYILLRYSSLPIALNHTLNNQMLKALEWTGFMFSAGNLLFILTLHDSEGVSVYTYMPKLVVYGAILLSLLHLTLPMTYINAHLFHIPHEVAEDVPYDEARIDFPTDYDIENPVTCREGLYDFIEYVKSENAPPVNLANSIKIGAFNNLRDAHLKDLATQDVMRESAEVRRENDFTFLDAYASRVTSGLALTRQRFEKEKNINLEQLITSQRKQEPNVNGKGPTVL